MLGKLFIWKLKLFIITHTYLKTEIRTNILYISFSLSLVLKVN